MTNKDGHDRRRTRVPAVRPRASALLRSTVACVLLCAFAHVPAYVYGEDQRSLWRGEDGDAETRPEDGIAGSVGGIVCGDGSVFSGFIIDVTDAAPWIRRAVLITTAHTFIDGDGRFRGFCWYLPAGRRAGRALISDVSVGLEAGRERKPADSGDWALALVNHPAAGSLGGLKVDFADRYDFDREREDPADFLAISFMKRHEGVALSSRCRPDDKRRYPAFAATDVAAADFRRMVIHDCDFAAGGSGGPLLQHTSDGWRVIAINTGETVAHEPGTLISRDYAPPDAFNFSRRLDRDFAAELTRYLESFE